MGVGHAGIDENAVEQFAVRPAAVAVAHIDPMQRCELRTRLTCEDVVDLDCYYAPVGPTQCAMRAL